MIACVDIDNSTLGRDSHTSLYGFNTGRASNMLL